MLETIKMDESPLVEIRKLNCSLYSRKSRFMR